MPISSGLHPDVVVQEVPDGCRYILPNRRIGRFRLAGFMPLALGVILSIFNAALMAGGGPGFGLIQGLLLLPYWGVTIGLMVLGLSLVVGHSEIELNGTWLRTVERVGFLRWSLKRSLEEIVEFKVVTPPITSGAIGQIGTVVVDFGDERKLWLATAYREDLLWPLAHDVANQVRRFGHHVRLVGMRDVTQLHIQTAAYEPSTTNISLERYDDDITITFPRSGFRGLAKWFLVSGLVWCLMIGGFAYSALSTAGDQPWHEQMAFATIIVCHNLIGVGLILIAFDLMFSRAAVAVMRCQLLSLQTGLFGTTRQEFARDEIAAIGVGSCGETIQGSIHELQIHFLDGRSLGFGQGHDVQELRWIALLLRDTLNQRLSPPEV